MHQKRLPAPTSWPITRKTHVWVTRPSSGPHSKEQCIPLIIALRDMLGLGQNTREIKHILNEGGILVDGVIRKDRRFPIGIFSIVSIPSIKKYYRVLLDPKRRFILHPIKRSDIKLCKIKNKTTVKGGAVQLNLHDGSNIIASNDYKTGDSILLKVPQREITKHLECKPGNLVMVIGGKHSGEIGSIKERKEVRSSKPNMVTVKGEKEFEVVEDYVFVVGIDKPEIDLEVVK
ncbi:MAG: 30S ribosomal protein S4e [Methanocellales archaeon]|nr:30S ribosomal protein S4e [Methanocellales archaeon]MDD3291134.1 30S ribosomal protein S4e [Methanocellales archaeon]MDD5235234.1 30S ribosomal protein S4e [Methanocellales archaeon]MDD5484610.1 30S ribosomal protein S4e [Methanocellales archaeon]